MFSPQFGQLLRRQHSWSHQSSFCQSSDSDDATVPFLSQEKLARPAETAVDHPWGGSMGAAERDST